MAASFTLHPSSIVALDRGYHDYAHFARWTAEGVFFVTGEHKNPGELHSLFILSWVGRAKGQILFPKGSVSA